MSFQILETDTTWYTSPDAGHPHCLCSRCNKLIKENDVPVRAWPDDGSYEYRFHPECLGFIVSKNGPYEIDNEFYDYP